MQTGSTSVPEPVNPGAWARSSLCFSLAKRSGITPCPLQEGHCPQERVVERNRMWVATRGGAGAWKFHYFLSILISGHHHPAPS